MKNFKQHLAEANKRSVSKFIKLLDDNNVEYEDVLMDCLARMTETQLKSLYNDYKEQLEYEG